MLKMGKYTDISGFDQGQIFIAQHLISGISEMAVLMLLPWASMENGRRAVAPWVGDEVLDVHISFQIECGG